MPYSSIEDLPDAFKNLPDGAKQIALRTMNAVLEGEEETDELVTQAVQAAWRNVKLKYRREGDKWVLRKDAGTVFAAFTKADDEQRTVWGIVYAADDEAIKAWQAAGSKPEEVPEHVVDSQGDWISEETLRKAFRDYMLHYSQQAVDEGVLPTGERHKFFAKNTVMLQAALLAKGTRWPDADSVPLEAALTWLRADYVGDDDLWAQIKKGEIAGYSMGGHGKR